MRKIAAAALALPILALIYGPVVFRRMLAGRVGIGIGTVAISGIVAVGLAAPVGTQAHPPVTVAQIGPAALAGSIEPHHGLREPVRLSFSSTDGSGERRRRRSTSIRRPASSSAGTPPAGR